MDENPSRITPPPTRFPPARRIAWATQRERGRRVARTRERAVPREGLVSAGGGLVRAGSCLAASGLTCAALLLFCAPAGAARSVFGSPLTTPASLDTANDLSFEGTNIALPGSVFHISHDAADTALWNLQLAAGQPRAPAGGQVLSIRLEGCARSNGPPPLTQIHFQIIAPQPGGSYQLSLTSQAFEIPVCGQGGADGHTVSTYQPDDFCVAQGDYVAFNDEGGFVPAASGPPPYPAGVPYMVMGSRGGSTVDAFVRNGGVGNGATLSPADVTNHDGFSSNPGEELLLQATLGTGADASVLCPGGTRGSEHRPSFPSYSIPTPQLDGMNAYGFVGISVYCHTSTPCSGELTLDSRPSHGGSARALGSAQFTVQPHTTGKVHVRLHAFAQRLVKHRAGGLPMSANLTGNPAAGMTASVSAPVAVHGA
jgi:hypothetical protein